MKTIAIPAEKLGVLEAQLANLPLHKLKRERKSDFNRLSRVLRDLKMVPKGDVVGLSFGVNCLGEVTAFVTYQVDTHERVSVPHAEMETS